MRRAGRKGGGALPLASVFLRLFHDAREDALSFAGLASTSWFAGIVDYRQAAGLAIVDPIGGKLAQPGLRPLAVATQKDKQDS